jgi:hypothetical protein
MTSEGHHTKYLYTLQMHIRDTVEDMRKKGLVTGTEPLADLITRQLVSYDDFPKYYVTLGKEYGKPTGRRLETASVTKILQVMQQNPDDPDAIPNRGRFWDWIRAQRRQATLGGRPPSNPDDEAVLIAESVTEP